MTDIVERLRSDIDYDCKEEAADEIERLRDNPSFGRYWREQCEKAEAEIGRLRASNEHYGNGYSASQREIERLRVLKTPASAKLLNITKAALDDAEAEVERLRAEVKRLEALGWPQGLNSADRR